MLLNQALGLLLILVPHFGNGYPSYQPLAGLSERDQDAAIEQLSGKAVYPPDPPGPIAYNGTKLVNDKDHPWKPLRKGDIRGPCPGLNTLASHGVRIS